MSQVIWLDELDLSFPPVHHALREPNGLLAAGGDLSPERLINAYQHGIFPWYEDGQPILWWSPEPRAVLFPEKIRLSRSLKRRIRRQEFDVRLDTSFAAVVKACAVPRGEETGTWITTEMQNAYCELHQRGVAHSIECFKDNLLVGGLYGLSLGELFFGESMFHTETDASKVAFAYLARFMSLNRGRLIDCQIENPHLTSLGSELMPRETFLTYLDANRPLRIDSAVSSLNWSRDDWHLIDETFQALLNTNV